jgi:hypothetical protein
MVPGRAALRVVFAEDNFLVRQGTAALLAEVPEVDVVRLAEDPVTLTRPLTASSTMTVWTPRPSSATTCGRLRLDHSDHALIDVQQIVRPAVSGRHHGLSDRDPGTGEQVQLGPALHHPASFAQLPVDQYPSALLGL